MNRIFSAVATILILSGLAFAQTAMRTTTLSLPVGVTDRSINLASVSGISPLSNGQVATILFVDKEVMYVQSITGSSVTVTRGQSGSDATAHNAAATVYVGPPGAYGSRNVSGACSEGSWPVTPYININNGNIYTCSGGNWVLSGTGGSAPTAGTGIAVTGSTVSIDPTITQTLANDQAGVAQYAVSVTGNDTYVVTLNPVLTAYTTGQCLVLTPDVTNTGTATVNVNSLGARSILTRSGAALADGDVVVGPQLICNDGTAWRLQSGGGASSSTSMLLPVPWVDDTSWTAYGSTFTYTRTATGTTAVSGGGTAIHGRYFAVSGTYTHTFALQNMQGIDDTAIGVFLTDGTAAFTCELVYQNSSKQRALQSRDWTNSSTFSADNSIPAPQNSWLFRSTGLAYYQVVRDGTNTTCNYSEDGTNWTQITQVANGSVGFTPTGVGYQGRAGNASTFAVIYRGVQ